MPAVILKYPIWAERQRKRGKRVIPSGPHLNTQHFACVSPIIHSFLIHRYKNSHYSFTLKGFMFLEWVKNSINQKWCWQNVAGKQYCAPCCCKKMHQIFKFPNVDHQSTENMGFRLLQNWVCLVPKMSHLGFVLNAVIPVLGQHWPN